MTIMYNSSYDLTIPFSDDSVQFALASNTALTYTLPGDKTMAYSVRFSYAANSNVFVTKNSTAVVPAAGTMTSVQYSEFKPGFDGSQRYALGGETISFITPDATAFCGISIRKLP